VFNSHAFLRGETRTRLLGGRTSDDDHAEWTRDNEIGALRASDTRRPAMRATVVAFNSITNVQRLGTNVVSPQCFAQLSRTPKNITQETKSLKLLIE